MGLSLLDSENADRDLTSEVAVLTCAPSTTIAILAFGYIALGDGAKDLDGSGGDFELRVTVGGQTIQPGPQAVTFGTQARAGLITAPFAVPAGEEVVIYVKSPNGVDSDVDVTAYLFDQHTLTNPSVTATRPVAATAGLLALVRGDDYKAADERALEWSSTSWPALGGATINLTIRDQTNGAAVLEAIGSVLTAGPGEQTVQVELTAAQTAVLSVVSRKYQFDVQATLVSGSAVTLVRGLVNVYGDQTR